MGAFLAYLSIFRPQNIFLSSQGIFQEVRSIIGMLMIVFSQFALDDTATISGLSLVLPSLGTFLVLSASSSVLNRHILEARILVWFGLISYPLYLWHWPLLTFLRIYFGERPPLVFLVEVMILSILLAWLTYQYIEKPIRAHGNNRFKVTVLVSLMIMTGGSGLLDYYLTKDGSWQNQKANHLKSDICNNDSDNNNNREERLGLSTLDEQKKVCIEAGHPLVLLWGDSYMASLYPGLKALQKNTTFSIARLINFGCPAFFLDTLNNSIPLSVGCQKINDGMLKKVKTLKPEIILVHANWSRFLNKKNLTETFAFSLAKIKESSLDSKIIVLGPVPQWQDSLEKSMIRYSRANQSTAPIYMSLGLLDSGKKLDEILEKMFINIDLPAVQYISLYKVLCQKRGCLTMVNPSAALTTYDNGHLSVEASIFVIDRIKDQLPLSFKE